MAGPRFARLEAKVSSRVDFHYGESMRVQPKAVGEFVQTSDPDRPAYDTWGVLDLEPKVVQMKGVGRHDGDYADIAGGAIHISFHESKLPAERRLWPKQGDTILVPSRQHDGAFRVVVTEPDGMGRIVCRCARAENAC